MRCDAFVKCVDLGIKCAKSSLTDAAALAQGGGLARLRRLIKLIAVYETAIVSLSGVRAFLMRKRPAKARRSGLVDLTAIGHVKLDGRCWRDRKSHGDSYDAKHERNSRQRWHTRSISCSIEAGLTRRAEPAASARVTRAWLLQSASEIE